MQQFIFRTTILIWQVAFLIYYFGIMEQFDAQPHWAKLDPNNLFASDFITRYFG